MIWCQSAPPLVQFFTNIENIRFNGSSSIHGNENELDWQFI
ncbi:hypothetical protein SLEP1_g58142 [Rubroshorea leprosula]|uniref:Uncharacterized protein n=1 Tax=Rubroshorea leprosula TaxID=152421 RepID=A0AAV5MPY0_9ROSI|nr:hypothetical protein SLEP1_g58142 [Rubroshorea leprosula]